MKIFLCVFLVLSLAYAFGTEDDSSFDLNSMFTNNGMTGSNCGKCPDFVKVVRDLKNAGLSTSKIIDFYVDGYCYNLPRKSRKSCAYYVEKSIPMIVKMIDEDKSNKAICVALGVCSSDSSDFHYLNAMFTNEGETDAECKWCKSFVKEVRMLKSDGVTTSEIIDFYVDGYCHNLPRRSRKSCAYYVEKFVPMIVKMIDEDKSNEAICVAIGVCSSEFQETQGNGDGDGDGGEYCLVCEMILKYVKQMLDNDASVTEIEDFLTDDVCDLLPGSLSQTCDTLVDKYVPEIVNLIEKDVDPATICTEIGLCS